MEWTIPKIKRLFDNYHAKVLSASCHFNSPDSYHGQTFNANVEIEGFERERRFRDYDGELVVELDTYYSLRAKPQVDDYEGWSGALEELLTHPEFERVRKAGGINQIWTTFKEKLESKLNLLGRVKYDEGAWNVEGYGVVDKCCYPSSPP